MSSLDTSAGHATGIVYFDVMGKDDVDIWNEELADEGSAQLGVNREMVRKALELNPGMRGDSSTADFLSALEKKNSAPAASTTAKTTAPPSRDLLKNFMYLKDRFVDEDKKLKAEVAQLQSRQKQLAPQTLDRLLQLLIELDPNLTSIQTQELIKMEGSFLTQIGFTARKVIERRMGKKS